MCLQYGIPLLSGKDSMYVDGHLKGRYGETRKISALETLQFSATGVIADFEKCVTLDAKAAGDRVYVLGMTRNELGASEYYEQFGKIGQNVPEVQAAHCLVLYRALHHVIDMEMVASAHGIYRGGLGVHLAMVAMGGNLGMEVNLADVPFGGDDAVERRNDTLLFSESAGRFIVTIDPSHQEVFEKMFKGLPCRQIGIVTQTPELKISGLEGDAIVSLPVAALKAAWKRPFGDFV
jgi:phosphoribosylformylglycinamidine synthase